MKTTLPLAEFPGSNPLVADYAAEFARVGSWFHYDPHSSDCFAMRLDELDARPAADRAAAGAAVVRQQQDWNAGAEALEAANLLGQPGTYTVVTGQQAGLFGGPLYTVLKAASAVKLARQLAVQFPNRKFVPTFWVSSGDSDFDEVRSTNIIAQDGSIADLALRPEEAADEGRIIGTRDVSEDLAAKLAEVGDILPGGQFREDILTGLQEAYRGGNLVASFARWMAKLFSGTELVLIEPQDEALMACARGLIEREIHDGPACEQALLARNAQIAGAGFALQVEHLEGDTNLFLLDGAGVREKISRHGEDFVLRPSGRELSRGEMEKLAAASPASFVLGVMLRPVYQNVLFPPVAFIGGAAELAYRAQATAVFDSCGEKMAPAFLRASATLLNNKQAALLDELGWELADCYTVPQDLAARAVEGLRPEELEGAMRGYRETLLAADKDLQSYAEKLDPNLGKSFETLRENLTRHADKLEKKISGVLKQKHAALVGQVERLHNAVYPGLTVQERRLNLLSFLPRYGFDLVKHLIEELDFPAWEHQVVILD